MFPTLHHLTRFQHNPLLIVNNSNITKDLKQHVQWSVGNVSGLTAHLTLNYVITVWKCFHCQNQLLENMSGDYFIIQPNSLIIT